MKAPKSLAQARRATARMSIKVAAVRDELRTLIADIEALAEDCSEAVDDIDRAADALSRLV